MGCGVSVPSATPAAPAAVGMKRSQLAAATKLAASALGTLSPAEESQVDDDTELGVDDEDSEVDQAYEFVGGMFWDAADDLLEAAAAAPFVGPVMKLAKKIVKSAHQAQASVMHPMLHATSVRPAHLCCLSKCAICTGNAIKGTSTSALHYLTRHAC